jgi:putative colanic acid biosynthesis acetyltransferase WcaF
MIKHIDPYLKPSTSIRNRIARIVWALAYATLFRLSFRTMHNWRLLILKLFGAKVGAECRIYRKAVIWAPWNLVCEDHVLIGDEAIIYNPDIIYISSHAVISQQAYLCGASHEINDGEFKMIWKPIKIDRYAWVAARANVMMGVRIGEGAVAGLGSVVTKDLESWTIYAGNPATKISKRNNFLNKSNKVI